MKQWKPTYIQQAEILQLILLANLFGQKASSDIYFQGGTALRWCYGGSRFSEDLDFETHLSTNELKTLLAKVGPAVRRDLIAHLGPGRFELQTTGCTAPLCKSWVKFSPANFRGNISVKLEIQQISRDFSPATQPVILGTLPAVAERVQSGILKTDPNSVLLVETLPEILAGKLRALFERTAYKGRDFWDIWFLDYSLGVKADPEILARKLRMYDFTLRHSMAEVLKDLTERRDATIAAITNDLKRFVPPQTISALEETQFNPIINSVQNALANIPDADFTWKT